MIRNFFTVALRNLNRNKIISFIHIVGLSIGISASLVIFLIVRYESSFDKFEKDNERIYRVVTDVNFNGNYAHAGAVPAPLANAAGSETSGIDDVVPVMGFPRGDNVKVVLNEKNNPGKEFRNQSGVVFTNVGYFNLLPFRWLSGSAGTAMQEPFSVVLTEERARIYFPSLSPHDVIGKQINYDTLTTTVTGVVADLNEITDFNALEFISYSTITAPAFKESFMMDVWEAMMGSSKLYVKLSPANDKKGVTAQLNALLNKYNANNSQGGNNTLTFSLQSLQDIHFSTTYRSGDQRLVNKSTLTGLAVIAVFLLLLACINFTNLATAQTSKRAMEIGVRKSIGSSRKQLIFQFLSETFCVAFAAACLSVATAPLFLALFSDFIPQGVHFEPQHDLVILLFLLLLVIAVTFIAGIYPALVLSGLRPASILKGQLFILPGAGGGSFRKALTVFQFTIAQVFVFGAFMVAKQIHYSVNMDMGFRKGAIIYFEIPRQGIDHREKLMNEIRMIPEISLATTGFLPPASSRGITTSMTYNNGKEKIKKNVNVRWGDPQFIDLYKIGIVAGRNVRNGKDVHEKLINETYAKEIGFPNPADALNHELMEDDEISHTIVGVMRDFHEGSSRSAILPLAFGPNSDNYFVHIALAPQSEVWPVALGKIGAAWHKYYPEQEFAYKFFDDEIAKFYTNEQNTARLLNWAMGLSILISCMGLLGLAMYTAETRTKEIGIRKILGASVANIISILSREFVMLVVIAFAIAVPLCWWSASQWLQTFAYRTAISWWVFALSGVTLIIVAMVTISVQTIKAATANPSDNLRSE